MKQGLLPCLQRDDVVVMDNLATHKTAGVREAIAATGAAGISAAVFAGLEPD